MDKAQRHGVYINRFYVNTIVLLLLIWHSQANATIQSLTDIEKQVYQFIKNEYKHDKTGIHIQAIDTRLTLQKCNKALTINWQHPVQAGRNLIKVQCYTGKQWKLYVPVKLEIFKQVYIAKTDIRKGETLHKLNTIRKLLDIGKLHRGYIENITPYDERKTRRNIRKGEVLNHNLFEISHTIKRGQQVILESGNNSIAVKVKGTALNNGQKGDLIKVKNNSSSIIVEAMVKDKGKAVVIY